LALGTLATSVGRSPSYFHRLFKATTGLTPKDYADAHRAARIRKGLMKNTSVTEAIYDAGFNSSGRFYEKSKRLLGMTPTQFRTGGPNEEINFAIGQTTLGAILVASSKKGVVAILLGDDPEKLLRDLQDRFPRAKLIGADEEYEKLVARVVGLIEAPRRGLNLPLDIRGTAFQRTGLARPAAYLRGNDRVLCGNRQEDRVTKVEYEPLLAPVPQTTSLSPSRVTVSFARMALCPATHGGSIANVSLSIGKANNPPN
jgi:AraC-like DNA-binding protein